MTVNGLLIVLDESLHWGASSFPCLTSYLGLIAHVLGSLYLWSRPISTTWYVYYCSKLNYFFNLYLQLCWFQFGGIDVKWELSAH